MPFPNQNTLQAKTAISMLKLALIESLRICPVSWKLQTSTKPELSLWSIVFCRFASQKHQVGNLWDCLLYFPCISVLRALQDLWGCGAHPELPANRSCPAWCCSVCRVHSHWLSLQGTLLCCSCWRWPRAVLSAGIWGRALAGGLRVPAHAFFSKPRQKITMK